MGIGVDEDMGGPLRRSYRLRLGGAATRTPAIARRRRSPTVLLHTVHLEKPYVVGCA
jgi:hypothetical protein